MEHVLSIVNDFFGNFLAISNYLWAFPTQYGWWTSRNHVVFGGNHLYAAIKIRPNSLFQKRH